ncbi:O-antigen ligase family protein [Collimonas sp.]|uniref:O-antigen ligase family protein n=1 Tax=Collimonas sp. TaxID=1963772 RepID=UPI002B71E74D|nr:O-antigen ligase family protein [Collimonas sp.]HWW08116.1 O-antigen ligase family protein [Collimonas sp.]
MSYIKWPVIMAILLFPALSIVLHNAGNTCLYVLLICSIVALICRCKPMGIGFGQLLKEYWPLHLAMASLFIAVILNQLSLGAFEARQYDRALRLAVFAPVFWIILAAPLKYLKSVQWAFIVGIIAAVIKIYLGTDGGTSRPSNIGFLLIIAFSDIALLLGSMTLLSIGWNSRRDKAVILLKFLIFCVSLYITILGQSRGTWIAIPFFVVFGIQFLGGIRIRHKLMVAVLALVVMMAMFSLSSTIQTRIAEAKSDVTQYLDGKNVDTSLGIRLQLWRVSWELFKERPVFGIGRENFSSGLEEFSSKKMISPVAAAFAHSHNELIFNMTILGIFGLLANLSIYCVPAYYFGREIRHPDRYVRTAAGMGMLLPLGFFIFGLTDLMFFWTVLGGFYCMSVATFLAIIIKRKKNLEQTDI